MIIEEKDNRTYCFLHINDIAYNIFSKSSIYNVSKVKKIKLSEINDFYQLGN